MVHPDFDLAPDISAKDEPLHSTPHAGHLNFSHDANLHPRFEVSDVAQKRMDLLTAWLRKKYSGAVLVMLVLLAVTFGFALGSCLTTSIGIAHPGKDAGIPRFSHIPDTYASRTPWDSLTPPSHDMTLVEKNAYKVRESIAKRTRLIRRSEENCGEPKLSEAQKAIYGILIPVLVILSGIFAGLTLGYMSLDETQLQVLIAQGSSREQRFASRIIPIRKDGHLLLTTLLIANMITNETLPIIADPLLGGGIQAVIVSIVLVVLFAELIPQSVCSRFGLQIGAYMAFFTRCVMIILWPIAWPVSRIMHYILGPHQGTVYRRAELKELVTMHAATGGRGGDLKGDTVAIVGGALDMQEKVAEEAMTPIDQVHMIPITARLDYATLETIVRSGHSRIPVYQDVEASLPSSGTWTPVASGPVHLLNRTLGRKTGSLSPSRTGSDPGEPNVHPLQAAQSQQKGKTHITPPDPPQVRRKIIGALLVKQCVLLDPEDAVPVSDVLINALPTVPWDEPLLNVLNVFQEGKSHMAIVSPHSSVDTKATVPAMAKVPAKAYVFETQSVEQDTASQSRAKSLPMSALLRVMHRLRGGKKGDLEDPEHPMNASGTLPTATIDVHNKVPNAPLGIITLEDVLEELIGEEILDEYDSSDISSLSSNEPVPIETASLSDAAAKPRTSVENWPGQPVCTEILTATPLKTSENGAAPPIYTNPGKAAPMQSVSLGKCT